MQHDHPLTLQQSWSACGASTATARSSASATASADARLVRRGRRARRPAVPRRSTQLGRQAGRPRRHVHVEHARAPRGLHGRAVHGRRAAHAQHPPVRRAAHLHRQPRRGPRDLRRRLARARCSRSWRRASRRSRTTSSWATATPARCPTRSRYEDLLAAQEPTASTTPSSTSARPPGLCYTSGTTGNPKGVLYSHRSNVLHALGQCMADSIGMRADDRVLPVVPMFHANAWGMPYGCAMTGADLVMPGSDPAAPRRWRDADRGRAGDRSRRGADDLDGPAALRRRAPARPVQPADGRLRRLGRAAHADAAVRGAPRRTHPPGLGDDRDEPARLGGPSARRSGRRGRRALALPRHGRAARAARRGRASSTTAATRCRGTASPTGELEVRGPWVARAYYERRRAATRSSTTAGCARATSPRSTRAATS